MPKTTAVQRSRTLAIITATATALTAYYFLQPNAAPAPLATTQSASVQHPDSPFGSGPARDLSEDHPRLPPSESIPEIKNLDSAEAVRVTNYLNWMSSFEKFQQAQAQGASPRELRSLAKEVDSGIDARIENREMGSAEALHLKSALIEIIEPDPSQRVQMLAQWRAAQANRAIDENVAAEAARADAFRQEQSKVVLAWNALPPQQRDPQQLESQLQTLRDRIFSPAK